MTEERLVDSPDPKLSDRWHVLLAPGDRPDSGTLARRLAPLLERPVYDVAAGIRYGRGWLARGVRSEQVELLRELLSELDLTGLFVPDDLPVSPPSVNWVRSAWSLGENVEFQTAREQISHPLREVGCVGINLLGRVGPSAENREKWQAHKAKKDRKGRSTSESPAATLREIERFVPTSTFSHYPELRAAIDEVELENPELFLWVAVREPVEIYRIDLGARFPEYGLVGNVNSTDNFLRFVDELMAALPENKILPETRTCWDTHELDTILMHKPEELENRFTWISEILAHDLWEGFR